jgi:hypothetical protein
VALLSEAGANGCTLLLHYGSLVGNRLRGSHIPNELLHYVVLVCLHRASCHVGLQEVIVVASRTPPGQRCGRQMSPGSGGLGDIKDPPIGQVFTAKDACDYAIAAG